jgi:hypothetical protein
MKTCENCKLNRLCKELDALGYTRCCNTLHPIPKTNADKIKQAGNESKIASAFVDFLCSVPCIGGKCKTPGKTCYQCVLDWLKQEVESDA